MSARGSAIAPAGAASEVLTALEVLLDAARAHGANSDDPEHEVGDLQEMLIAAWQLLSPRARKALVTQFQPLVSEWGAP